MSGLFSMFDPSTSDTLSLNWFILFPGLMLLPKLFHLYEGRLSTIFSILMDTLSKDFSMSMDMGGLPGIIPFLCSQFLFILSLNFLGLMPYNFTASSNLAVTSGLALVLWVSIMLGFFLLAPNHFLSHLVPQGTPGVLIPFMVIIEMISTIIRPLTLAVRLAANMVAGHLLICLVNGVTYSSPILPIALLGGVLLMALELSVVFIQAYVFSTLSSLYFAEFNNAAEV